MLNPNQTGATRADSESLVPKPNKTKQIGTPQVGEDSKKSQTKYPWLWNIPLITEQAVEKVSHFLDTVAKGRDVDLRSPLYGGAPREELLDKWNKILIPKIKDIPQLLEFEASNKAKASPMSIMLPYAERAGDFESYFTNPGGSIDDHTLAVACDAVKDFVGLGVFQSRLRPLTIEAACDRLPSNTSWALPYALRGKVTQREKGPETETSSDGEGEVKVSEETVIDNRPLYLALAREMAEDLNHPGWEVPCMGYWRGDLGKEATKQRVVWGYPHAVSILESMFYPVLTDAIKGKPGFAAWTNLAGTEQGVFSILEGSTEETPVWAFDASGFDKHLTNKLIDAVCENIIIPCFQRGSAALIRRISQYSKECGIVTPDGVLTGRDFNRPSGSGGTNILDCFENLVMWCAVLLSQGVSYETVVALLKQVMGDDAVYATLKGFDVEEVTHMYKELFGTIVNIDKEALSDQFTTYCKRLYVRGETQSWASSNRALLKACSYERNRPEGWNPYCDSVRWIMQSNGLA